MVLLEARQAAAALQVSVTRPTRMTRAAWPHLVRAGWYRPVHVKSPESHKLPLLLGHRRTLKRKLLDIENEIRQSLKVFGLLVGPRVQRASFTARVRDLVAHDRLIEGITQCMLRAWEALWAEYKRLHDLLVQMVGRDELCRRFCAIPGVGPVTALTFKAAIDDPHRFSKSKTLGAHFGLTPGASRRHIDRHRRAHFQVRRWGGSHRALRGGERDAGAFQAMVRHHKAWGVRIAAKRGHKRAVVAVARKLAVVMHRMWIDGSVFRFAAEDEGAAEPNSINPTALAAAM